MRNFQLLGTQNVNPLLHQLTLHPDWWNIDRIRTATFGSPHSACDDILLRFQGKKSSVLDDPECEFYPAWFTFTEAHALIFDLARVVKAERIGRIIISRLPPGKTITPHEDGGAVASYYTRYQMPLQSAPGCVFECDGEKVQMIGGQVWWFDNKKTHAVYNNSDTDRLAMIADLKTW